MLLQDLAEGEAADGAVVGGEAAVLEDRVAEQVGGHHGGLEAGLGQGSLEVLQDQLALRGRGIEGDQVVVVERDAVGAKFAELVDRFHGVQGFRVATPKGSAPVQPTVQRPKVNLSPGVGVESHDASLHVGDPLIRQS